MKKWLSFAIVLLCVTSVSAQQRFIIDRSPEVRIETDMEWIRRFEADIEKFRQRDRAVTDFSCDVLFFGSSSIRLWSTLAEDMAPLNVVNRGYGGASVRDILYNYQDILSAYTPKKIVFYCDNDISGGDHDVTVGELYDLYRILFDQLRRDYPGVPVYFLSGKYSRARTALRSTQQLVNELVRVYAGKSDLVTYVDVTSLLLKEDGEVDDRLYLDDNLHITHEGYLRWTSVLKPLLLEN